MQTFTAKAEFDQRYQTHLQHLKLKGLQPKSIDVGIPVDRDRSFRFIVTGDSGLS